MDINKILDERIKACVDARLTEVIEPLVDLRVAELFGMDPSEVDKEKQAILSQAQVTAEKPTTTTTKKRGKRSKMQPGLSDREKQAIYYQKGLLKKIVEEMKSLAGVSPEILSKVETLHEQVVTHSKNRDDAKALVAKARSLLEAVKEKSAQDDEAERRRRVKEEQQRRADESVRQKEEQARQPQGNETPTPVSSVSLEPASSEPSEQLTFQPVAGV